MEDIKRMDILKEKFISKFRDFLNNEDIKNINKVVEEIKNDENRNGVIFINNFELHMRRNLHLKKLIIIKH